MKLAILYLGSRGAGIDLTKLICSEFNKKNIPATLFSKENHTTNPSDNFVNIVMPKSRFLAFMGFRKNAAKKRIIQESKKRGINTLIIPMAHPWDLSFQKTLRAMGIRIIRIVHDPEKHPGDIWPRDKDILKLCNVDGILTLSHYTAGKLAGTNARVIASCVPNLNQLANTQEQNFLGIFGYDLIIGRHKKYQNTKNVINWWIKLPTPVKQNRKLLIAGEINKKTSAQYKDFKDVIFYEKWLSVKEFNSILENADRVLCLYVEASQSGIITAAQNKKIPVLASNVGGLSEQIELFGGGLIADVHDKNDWQEKYHEINLGKISRYKQKNMTQMFLKDLFTLIKSVRI